ncbi:MAG: hypothetical protein ACREDK_06620 [Thermoplasmata archaeon]
MTIRSFESVDRSTFRWLRREGAPTAFDLLSGDDLVASLTWARTHGTLANGGTASDHFTLKREGFLAPHVLARDPRGGVIARLDLHLRSSLLTVGTTSFVLRRKGLLILAWQLATLTGAPLLHIETVAEHGALKGGVVAVEPAARDMGSLPLMLLVSWYYLVQAWFEEEAASVSTAAVVASG